MSEKTLSFENVGLAYRRNVGFWSSKNWVINNLTFDLYKGEVLGVIGKNGAGKSTLLRLIADIVKPNQGDIWRKPKTRAQLLTLGLGFNNQLSGADNAIMSLVILGKSIKEAKSLISNIKDFSELDDLLNYPVSTYSSGEKARLGFAIAIQAKPDILLLDEMLGVGDKDFQKKSSQELKKIVNSEQTVVLVSHSNVTLKQFCHRLLWIENGTNKAIGPCDHILKEYLKK
ncbi:ABC transporter ATP-binding protein [Sessilibacter corallicola]|uniref:ABC transporter domain-containing protein n=1 Tax=Sessilibacter corallicola TaxID=2904075 RepID=A0ABQ0A831_9GAMM